MKARLKRCCDLQDEARQELRLAMSDAGIDISLRTDLAAQYELHMRLRDNIDNIIEGLK